MEPLLPPEGLRNSSSPTRATPGSADSSREGAGAWFLVLMPVLMLTASPAPASAAEWRKLTEGAPFSDVAVPRLSPNGRWAVFWWDRDLDDAEELYSVPVDGSAPPERISGLLPVGGHSLYWPYQHEISPDSSTVVYVASQDTGGVYELYSVPIGGGLSVKLNGPLAPGAGASGGDVDQFAISPTGDRVIYTSDEDTDGVFELYSVPLAGGLSVKLNGALTADGNVMQFRISPTGNRVVYLADQQADEVFELYSVPLSGGAAVKLNGALVAGGDVSSPFLISPSGSRVLYRADQQADEVFELYSVPIAGGPSVKLNGALATGGSVTELLAEERHEPPLPPYAATADRAVYLADQQADGVYELYSVPIAGGAPVKLNGALVAGGDVVDRRISPAGDRVVYLADQQGDDVYELYSVPIMGGSPVKLSDLGPNGDALDYQFSPDGAWVVYRADQTGSGSISLFRAPAAGPAGNQEVLASLFPDSSLAWRFDPRGDRVVVLSKGRLDSIVRLWWAWLADPVPSVEQLVDKAFFPPDGDVSFFRVGSDGSIVYWADQDTNEELELYSIPAPLFVDGFESGDPSAWSVSAP